MSFHLSTKERLLAIVDDIEIIAKELIENTIAPKHQKVSSTEHALLVDLLVSKDTELKAVLQLASDQTKIEQKMTALRAQVELQDQEINQLQKQLKEAEQYFTGNKKLVPSEELIKYAHRISASHAISAPLTWQQGDLRRPYPTDIEMRLGFLGKSDLNINGHSLQHHSSLNEMHRNTTGEIPASAQNQFAWHPSGELHMSVLASGGSILLDTRARKNASQVEVEVMSTESSSSSSSDSQYSSHFGDLRRPYPTDIEMRLGFLGKSDLNINGHSLQHHSSLNEMHRNTTGEIPASAQNQFAWHPSGELHMSVLASGGSILLDTRI
uniref:Mediator of RNA polymerase II transcription subunit 4 n=1 Tax=Lutzomyia longipalpis TaxID=7200 RepID=A0A1B0CG95_LUTLO